VIKEKSNEEYREWLKKEMKAFKKFLHEKKKERRRKGQNLEQRFYFDALQTFNTLMDEIDSFDKAIQKRLRKIEKNWEKFRDSILLKAHPPPTTA